MTADIARAATTIHYDLHTCVVAIDLGAIAGETKLSSVLGLNWLLAPRAVDRAAPGKPVCAITIKMAERLDAPTGEIVFDYPSAAGGQHRCYRDAQGGLHMMADEHATASLQPGGTSTMTVAASAAQSTWMISELMLLLLDHAMTANDQCLCHAACVATADRTGAVLLHAPSGTGKSTTAGALASLGMPILGDDSAALVAATDGNGVRAWGLPRGLRLHRRSAEMLPRLGDLAEADAWDAENEQMIPRAALVEAGLAVEIDPLPVKAVIALKRSEDATAPSVTDCDAFEGLRDLLADNLSTNEHGFFSGHERRLDIFSQMVAASASFAVQIGGSPLDVAAAIRERVDRL